MRPTRIAAAVALLLLGAGVVRSQSAAPTPDVPALVAAAQRNGESMYRRAFEYSWSSKTHVRRLNKRGRVVNETSQEHEVYPLAGRAFVVQKLVGENGQPLQPKRAAREQQRVNAELAQADLIAAAFADSLAAAMESTGCTSFGIWTVLNAPGGKETSFGVSDFLCFGEFSSPRVERVGGRDAIVLDFRPRAGFTPPSLDKSPFARLVGRVWIDAADKVVTRVEAWLAADARGGADPRALSRADAVLLFEDARLPTGMWVRALRYVNTTREPAAFNGLNMELRQEFTDYKRYYAEVKQYVLESPQKSETPQPPQPKP